MLGTFIFSTPTTTATSLRPAAIDAYAARIAACPETHAISVRMIIRRGSIPSCSATRGAGYAWKARRSTRAEPTKRESTSFFSRPSTSSKRAFPASWTSSLYVAWRTPHFVRPTPTIATLRIRST